MYPDTWQVTETYTAPNGLHLTKGMTVGIRGERGRFRFQHHTLNCANGKEWITVIGGTGTGAKDDVVMFRAFRPERVTHVYKVRVRTGKGKATVE